MLVDNSQRVSTQRDSLRSKFSIPLNCKYTDTKASIVCEIRKEIDSAFRPHIISHTHTHETATCNETAPNKIDCLPSCGNRKFSFRRILSYEKIQCLFQSRKSMCVKLLHRSCQSASSLHHLSIVSASIVRTASFYFTKSEPNSIFPLLSLNGFVYSVQQMAQICFSFNRLTP